MESRPGEEAVREIPLVEFIIAVIVLMFLETVLLYRFLVAPQMNASHIAHTELMTRRVAHELYKNELNGEVNQVDLYDSLKEQILAKEKKLPSTLHNEDIAIEIGRFAAEHNITVDAVSYQERQLVDPNEYAAAGAGVGANAGAGMDGANSGANTGVGAGAGANSGTNAGAGAGAGAASAASSASAATTTYATDASEAALTSDIVRMSALSDVGGQDKRTLSLQGVQISFRSEFHTVIPFLRRFEDGDRIVRIKSVSISRIQEGELKGVINLEYAALSPSAEQNYPGLYTAAAASAAQNGAGEAKRDSLFGKYGGFVEEGADPTILLLSEDDDIDPDFYIVLKASSSNETKISFGAYPRVETEVRSNVNGATRSKLTIEGDAEQFEYAYSLASSQKGEKRRLSASGGKIRVKVLSCQRLGDDDAVAILLDVENKTGLPVEITVINDDVLNPRFHTGLTAGDVKIVTK